MRERYSIIERLDQGGMAEVFRGVAESIQGFKKSVAIKRMLPKLAKNQKFVEMFLDEAKLSLYLQHANIVQVFDIGKSGESYFLVMEYVNGCNLKSLLDRLKRKGERMPIPEAIYLMLESLKGLSYAHHVENPETGVPLCIVHRDISPPNVLMSRNGEVKVVDFGLAKASSQISDTDPGVVKGKFSYLSPEAASGAVVDHRTDIFAVGIILWEMFTGRRLFYGDNDYETVQLVRDARIPSLAALNPSVEHELEQIVRRALARDPNDRYQEAADLADDLAGYLFGRSMKVTSQNIAALVKDTHKTRDDQRNPLVNVLIRDEMDKLTSLLDEGPSRPTDEHAEKDTVDPADMIDTSSWIDDFNLDD